MSREVLKQGFTPSGVVPWHFWLGMSVVVGLLALLEWDSPSHPPFTGRWGWLHQAVFSALGSRGLFALFATGAAGAFAYGLLLRYRARHRQG